HRRAGTDPARPIPGFARPEAGGPALRRRRPDNRPDAVRRAVPVDLTETPGPAAPRRLPSAQWLGPRPARQEGAVRRVGDVGRLPRAGAGAAHPAPGATRAVLHVLR